MLSRIGRLSSWLSLSLVLLITVDVLLRYLLQTTRTWIIDLEWHLFALLFLLGGAGTWLADKHVRVDLFYGTWTERRQTWVNIMGSLLFLLPWCGMMIWTTWRYASQSWMAGEGSPDPNGLPARYLIKAAMVVGFVMLFLAGLIRLREDIRGLGTRDNTSA